MKCKPIKDILRYHKIDCYALHTSTKSKNRFFSALRGVPLNCLYLHAVE